MNKKLLILFSFTALFIISCGGKATRVDPTVVSTSYDYTKPADISNQSKPVWVLPIINKGWIPARVDPKTGDWISGHYQATIVQDGYWATQEEAELSGRPYIIAGESSPIIPTPVTQGATATGGGGGELDIAVMQKRIDKIDRAQQAFPTAANEEKFAELSAQIQGIAQNVPSHYQTTTPANQNMKGFEGGITVQGSPSLPNPQDPTLSMGMDRPNTPYFSPYNGSTIILPPMPAGTIYEIPSNQQLPNKLTVHYLQNNQVELEYMGKKKQIQLNNPTSRMQLDAPRTVNLDEPPASTPQNPSSGNPNSSATLRR